MRSIVKTATKAGARTRSALAGLAVLAAVATGCGSHSHPATGSPAAIQAAVNQRVDHLRSVLPAGFAAPGRATAPPPAPADLAVAPASNITPAQFHLAPLPTGDTLKSVLAAAVNEPLPLTVGPLFVTTAAAKAGGTLTAVATHLSPQPNHAARFLLYGPGGYRAERLVAVGDDIAAGVITLPAGMAKGPWYLIVEDHSEVTSTGPDSLGGTVLVDVGQLTLSS